VVTLAARRKAVARLMDHHQTSERRACKAIGFSPMTIRYETRLSDDMPEAPTSEKVEPI